MSRILLLDIETAPNLAYVWGLWKENIPIARIVNNGYVLSWAAKWLGEKALMFDSIHNSTPRQMLRRIWKLLDKADIVIHYNGKSFDIPTLNKEFITHHLNPPSPYKQLDLLLVVRENFRFPSNKLDYVLQTLKIGHKVRHPGFEMWVKTMNGDKAAWKHMEKYNKGDVTQLEKLYLRVRPWVKNHPSVSVFTDGITCPYCGAKNQLQRRGTYPTKLMLYPRFQCQKCGGWSRGNKTLSRRGASRLMPTE